MTKKYFGLFALFLAYFAFIHDKVTDTLWTFFAERMSAENSESATIFVGTLVLVGILYGLTNWFNPTQ